MEFIHKLTLKGEKGEGGTFSPTITCFSGALWFNEIFRFVEYHMEGMALCTFYNVQCTMYNAQFTISQTAASCNT